MAAPELDDHIEEHSSFIKTPRQLLTVVFLAFVVPIAVLVMLATLATHTIKYDKRHPGMSDEAIAERLKPVAHVVVGEAAGPAGSRSGEAVYKETCSACHAAGVLNAPKLGDKQAWAAHLAESQAVLVEHAIKGIRQMPPKGGNPGLTDDEVARAVVFMANRAGANFKEPAPAAAAAQASKPEPAASTPAGAPAAVAAPAAAPTAAPASVASTGEKTASAGGGKAVYDQVCMACHAAGVAGAPKAGDKAAWAPRIKQGMEALYASALKGKGAMPPKGGAVQLSDADIKSGVEYMVGLAK